MNRPAQGSRPLADVADEALLASMAAGEEAALGELYDRFGAAAYRMALRIVRDPGFAEDVVQEAFLCVWRTASTFDPSRRTAKGWLLMFVHRRAVAHPRNPLLMAGFSVSGARPVP